MKALVIGGGIGGLAAAIALRRVGIEVEVHERAKEPGEVGAGISLWGNAVRALRHLGADGPVLARSETMDRAEIRLASGAALSVLEIAALDVQFGFPSVIVHRADLHAALLGQVPPECVRFGRACVSARTEGDRAIASFEDGSDAEADVLVGADGLRSAVRASVNDRGLPRYAGYTCWRGVVSWPDRTTIPSGHLSESWGRGVRFGIARMKGDRIYWFATQNAPPLSKVQDVEGAAERLRVLFAGFWKPIPNLIAATPRASILRHDLFDRKPARGWSRGRLVLLGDAAHPTTPNIGQGGCLAIEDAVVLARSLAVHAKPEAAFAAYEAERFERCAQITGFSWRLGQVGQLENRALAAIRNAAVRFAPRSALVEQHRRYAGFDVGPLGGPLKAR